MFIPEDFPSIVAILSEIQRYNKKVAKGKATTLMNGDLIEVHCQRYDDENDVMVDEIRLSVTEKQIKEARDELLSMVDILQAFIDLTKDMQGQSVK